MASSEAETMPLNMTDVESDAAVDEAAPVSRAGFRISTKVVLAAALLGVFAFAGVHMNSGRSNSDTATLDLNAITELAESEDVDPKVAVVYGILKAWGKNKFSGRECKEEAKKAGYSTDVVLDGRGISEKVWGKRFEGLDGACECFAHIAELPFKMGDFKLQGTPYASGNNVIFGVSYDIVDKESEKKIGEKSFDGQMWTFNAENEVIHWTALYSDPKLMNKAVGEETPEANDDIKVVQKLMKNWGEGMYKPETCMTNVELIADKDVVFNAVAPTKHTDGFKMYTGFKGFCDWNKFVGSIEMLDFEVMGYTPHAAGVVGQTISYKLPLSDNKKSSTIHDFQWFSIKDNKITGAFFGWSNFEELDKYFEGQSKL